MGQVNKRCILLGGAEIRHYDRLRPLLSPEDFVVCCDSGLNHCAGLAVSPDLIVGDFDSHPNPGLPVETIVLPCEKDDTDTVYAAKEALRRGFRRFLLLGVLGGRIDHTLGNLSLLLYLHARGAQAEIRTETAAVQVVDRSPVTVAPDCRYFSLLCPEHRADGVWIQGAKYPLEDGTLTCEYPLGLSNQVLPGGQATVWADRGRLFLIRIFSEEL